MDMTQKDIIEKFNLKINFNDPHKIQNHDKIHYENTIIELEDELNVLRKSLVDFYLQISTEFEKSELEDEREKMSHLAPTLIFEYIKRSFLNLKEDRGRLEQLFTGKKPKVRQSTGKYEERDEEKYIITLENEKEKLTNKVLTLKHKIHILEKKNEELIKIKKHIITSTKIIEDQSNMSHKLLISELKAKERELSDAKCSNDEKDEKIQNLKATIIDLQKLANKVNILESKYVEDLTTLHNTHLREIKDSSKQIQTQNVMLAKNAKSEEQLHELKDQLKKYKNAEKEFNYIKRRLDHVHEKMSEGESLKQKVQNDYSKLEIRLKSREETIQQQKKKIEKLEKKVKILEKNLGKRTEDELKDIIEEPVNREYKKMYEEKEAIIGKFTKRFKELTVREKQGIKRDREFQTLNTGHKMELEHRKKEYYDIIKNFSYSKYELTKKDLRKKYELEVNNIEYSASDSEQEMEEEDMKIMKSLMMKEYRETLNKESEEKRLKEELEKSTKSGGLQGMPVIKRGKGKEGRGTPDYIKVFSATKPNKKN